MTTTQSQPAPVRDCYVTEEPGWVDGSALLRATVAAEINEACLVGGQIVLREQGLFGSAWRIGKPCLGPPLPLEYATRRLQSYPPTFQPVG